MARFCWVVAATLMGGCDGCGWLFQLPVFPDAGVLPVYDSGVPERYQDCTDVVNTPLQELLGPAALRAAEDAVAQGSMDVALTADGCVRLELVEGDGGLQERALVSYQMAFVEVDNVRLFQQVRGRLWRGYVTSSGSWRVERDLLDVDTQGVVMPDGRPETSQEFTSDATGAWTGDETVDYALDGTPRQRWTRTRAPTAGQVAVREEVFQEGAWVLRAEYETDALQAACVSMDTTPPPPAGPCEVVPCTRAQKSKVKKELFEALAAGYGCEIPWGHTASVWDEVAVDLIEPVCIKGSGCNMAEVDTTANPRWDRNPNKVVRRPLRINVAEISSKTLRATLFHELLHVGLGAKGDHQKGLLDLAHKRGKLGLVDKVYACERYCFSEDANCCDCATCFGKKTCDCNTRADGTDLHKCPEPEPGVAAQTGAACRANGAFCDTLAECQAECGGISCTNFSRACGDCN